MRCAAASWQVKVPKELGFKYLHVLRNWGGIVIKAEAAVMWGRKIIWFHIHQQLTRPRALYLFPDGLPAICDSL